MRSRRRRRGAVARRVVGGFQPLGTNRSEPGGAGGMRADGGEAVEVRKQEGLAEGTNEEDGRHGLRGRSEVGELVRMRSRLHASAADQAEPEACGPMAVKPLRCASTRGRPRAQVKRTAAMVSEAVRRSARLVRMRGVKSAKEGCRGPKGGAVVRLRQPAGRAEPGDE